MKEIILSKGAVAIVDDEDYEYLNDISWHLSSTGYAHTTVSRRHFSMHKMIMRADRIQLVDHINGDPLDNRKVNLRLATHTENMCNRKMDKRNKSGYRGVCWNKKDKKFKVTIQHNNCQIHLGMYSDILEAAQSYNKAAIKYHGEFARLNKIGSL